MTLLGFVTMMIYGVAYHVLPRFAGHPLHSRRLAGWHWWASNAGLLGMSVGFALRPTVGGAATPVLAAGGVLSALGAYAFAYGMWRTIDGPAAARRARARAARGGALPVAPESAGAPPR
jgi:cbb3-type cytochrome oxidase subunit 1